MTFNINRKATVTLTKKGAEILNEYHNSIPNAPKVTEGYVYSSELWMIMNIFGSHLYNGCAIPFVNNRIDIYENN